MSPPLVPSTITHKESHEEDGSTLPAEPTPAPVPAIPDLNNLDLEIDMTALYELFRKYPTLKPQLREIYSSALIEPPPATSSSALDPHGNVQDGEEGEDSDDLMSTDEEDEVTTIEADEGEADAETEDEEEEREVSAAVAAGVSEEEADVEGEEQEISAGNGHLKKVKPKPCGY
ncbi:MAG: hypothetical protein M4579_007194 [Chaenotheca gracillima]|nr:MAG: hypothetical protein M4579_007194 [Chaenotheca gracillima]